MHGLSCHWFIVRGLHINIFTSSRISCDSWIRQSRQFYGTVDRWASVSLYLSWGGYSLLHHHHFVCYRRDFFFVWAGLTPPRQLVSISTKYLHIKIARSPLTDRLDGKKRKTKRWDTITFACLSWNWWVWILNINQWREATRLDDRVIIKTGSSVTLKRHFSRLLSLIYMN